jgi:hypothetical protein
VSSPPSHCRCHPVVLPSPSCCPTVAIPLSYRRRPPPVVVRCHGGSPGPCHPVIPNRRCHHCCPCCVILSLSLLYRPIIVLIVSSCRCPHCIVPSLSSLYRPVVVLVILSPPSCHHSYDPGRPTNEKELILLSSVVSSLSLAPLIPPYEQRLIAVIMGGCLVGHGSCYTVLPLSQQHFLF